MKDFLKVLTLGCFVFLHCAQACAEALPQEQHDDIEKLLGMTNALARGKQMSDFMVKTMAATLKASNPKIPDKVIAALPEVTTEVLAEQTPALKEMLISLYAQYYTADDIKALIAFYSSDIGQKTIRITPLLMQDGIAQGAAWGRSLGPEIARRLKARFKEEHIELNI